MAIIKRDENGEIIMIILEPGDPTEPSEWPKLPSRRTRKMQAKMAFANANFEEFNRVGIREAIGQRTRAGVMYAAYLRWFKSNAALAAETPMSIRAFGDRVKRLYPSKFGQGRTVTYEGIAPVEDC